MGDETPPDDKAEAPLMPANNNVWTPAMEQLLLQLFEEGWSYGDMASMISKAFKVHITRNACIGKGKRMQVSLKASPRKGRPCPKRKSPSLGRNLPRRRKRRADGNRQRLLNRKPHRRQSQRNRGLLLPQLLPHSCRWPEGDRIPYTFCGDDQVDGSSYCLKHTLIASPGYGRVR